MRRDERDSSRENSFIFVIVLKELWEPHFCHLNFIKSLLCRLRTVVCLHLHTNKTPIEIERTSLCWCHSHYGNYSHASLPSFLFTLFDPLNLLRARVTVHLSVTLMRSPTNIQAALCDSSVANNTRDWVTSFPGQDKIKRRRPGSVLNGWKAEECLFFPLSSPCLHHAQTAHTGGHTANWYLFF